MKSRRHEHDIGLDIFAHLGVPIEPWGTHPKGRTLAHAALALPLYGLVLGVLAVPLLLAFSGISKTVLNVWEDMEHDLGDISAKQQSVMLDSNGNEFARVFTENRELVELDEVSKAFIDTLITVEDSRFYERGALDWKGVVRSLARNLTSETTQGGSTLTQQLVENLRLMAAETKEEVAAARPSDLLGKLQELRYAVELERNWSKDEILGRYLNSVYFGNGAYGVEAAAQRYFSISAAELDFAQSAILVAILKSPTHYDPIAHPENSVDRRNVVLNRMRATGQLTGEQYDQLSARPLALNPSTPENGCGASKYPYYCALVLSELSSQPEYGETSEQREKFLSTGGLRIHTALDPKAANVTQRAVSRALSLDNRVAAGVAVVQPGTGRIRAVAQNREYGIGAGQTEIVYANTTNFQVGSTFKPIVLAAGLEAGITAQTRYSAPSGLTIKGLDAPRGGFRNSGGASYGQLDAYEATKRSVNTWFVKLVADAGVVETATMARRLGMASIPNNLTGKEASIALGAYETSPIQLAGVYATFAARGVACRPLSIISIERIDDGASIDVPDSQCHQAVMSNIADTVADTLLEPFKDGGTATGLALDGRKAAGKTGTTNDNAATWFAGFTPQAATAVWVGDPRGGSRYPLRNVRAYGKNHATVFGSSIAGPIWQETMNRYHHGVRARWLPAPSAVSGTLTTRIVPVVYGMGLDEAVTLLRAEGFKVRLNGNAKEHPILTEPGYVAAQSPMGGSNTGWGTEVVLTPTHGTPKFEVTP